MTSSKTAAGVSTAADSSGDEHAYKKPGANKVPGSPRYGSPANASKHSPTSRAVPGLHAHLGNRSPQQARSPSQSRTPSQTQASFKEMMERVTSEGSNAFESALRQAVLSPGSPGTKGLSPLQLQSNGITSSSAYEVGSRRIAYKVISEEYLEQPPKSGGVRCK